MSKPDNWAVIEQAGYVGENLRRDGLPSYSAANAEMRRLYPDAEEREALHVDIAYHDGAGWSYDY